MTINLTTRLAPFDFQADTVDAAVHFGMPEWQGAKLDFLMGETVVPACSPAMLKAHKVKKPADLLELPLLHLASRPDAWERWFHAMKVPTGRIPGMLVDQFAMAAQAAAAGLGVALLPKFLVEHELAAGDLVVAMDRPVESSERYYLAWPPNRENYPPLQAFREWIRGAAKAA